MQQCLEAGLASSTKKVHTVGWNCYCNFTNLCSISPSPITLEKVTLFVAFSGTQGLAVSTIESYLAVLRHMLLMSNPSCAKPSFHSPHMAILPRGIKRVQSQARSPSDPATHYCLSDETYQGCFARPTILSR